MKLNEDTEVDEVNEPKGLSKTEVKMDGIMGYE